MLTARLDYKKIKESKNISYLDSWYCPLEKAGHMGLDPVMKEQIANLLIYQHKPTLILNSILLKLNKKQAMAGL